jgi:hypothetical protein
MPTTPEQHVLVAAQAWGEPETHPDDMCNDLVGDRWRL